MLRQRFSGSLASFLVIFGVAVWLGCTPSENNTASNSTDAGQSDPGQAAQPTNVGDGQSNTPIDTSSPDAAIQTFLSAVQVGDGTTASSMLTAKAQAEMQNAEMHVLPPGSPYAKFTIDNVSYEQQHGGAFVASTWTDIVDEQTQEQRSYEITWILRQENNQWRVAGMSTALFPNQPPLVLNFEDPADMQAQVQQANAEMLRQSGAEGEIRQATLPPESTNPQR